MSNLFRYMIQRSFASRALDVVKMKAFVPCDVEFRPNDFKCRILDVVYDPLRVEAVNQRFAEAGYHLPEGMAVIAVTDDDTLLLWGGVNSVYHLRKGEQIVGAFDNLAFDDILDLTERFRIKNKRPEIDALLSALREKYGKPPGD